MHTAIGVRHTGYADCLLTGSGWNADPDQDRRSILIPLASSQHNLYDVNLLLCAQF